MGKELPYISPISPLCLAHISPISRLYLPCISRDQVQHGEDMRRVFDWFDRDRDGGACPLYLPHISRTSPAHLPYISRISPVYLPRISVLGVSAAELHAAIRSLGGASTLSLQEANPNPNPNPYPYPYPYP